MDDLLKKLRLRLVLWFSLPLRDSRILGFAVLLAVLFVDFRVELDLWSAVALKSTKSLL